MSLQRFAVAFIATATVGTAASAFAETIKVNDGIAVRESTVERPTRGMTMESVEKKFGAPASKHAAVGQPPITRWDYPGFSVFFEHQYVIHSVTVGAAPAS